MLASNVCPHRGLDVETTEDEVQRLRAELVVIDEQILDPRPSMLRRAELLAARKRVYEALHPSSRHGGAPGRAGGGKVARSDAGLMSVRSHAADAAARTGLSARTVRQLVQIAEDIPSWLLDEIRGTHLASHQRQLLEVARACRDPEEQRRRVDAFLKDTRLDKP